MVLLNQQSITLNRFLLLLYEPLVSVLVVQHKLDLRLLLVWKLGLLLEHLLKFFSWDYRSIAIFFQFLLDHSIVNVSRHTISAAILTPDLVLCYYDVS